MSNLTPMAKEAKRLYRLGFAVHWLHPKSKRPIGNQWATGPRKKWSELSETYQPNLNVGVRLGTPSQFENGYLAVIDVDIKSEKREHRREAIAALRKLIGDEKCPEVRSGRGNGSRHLYCITPTPFKTWNPAESTETVKVLMPSKQASSREKKELSETELRQGWRLSKAWEISLYSDGRQVVLPPSIHPDTNKPYFWKENLTDLSSLPVLEFENPKDSIIEVDFLGREVKRERKQQETVEDFNIDETLDVRWLPDLDEGTRKLIVSGLWRGKKIEDRSAYLLPAATGLVSAGLTKDGVLTVLTDRSTFLGECAFDHAQTKSRKRAAQWLWNYTVKRVMEERDPKRVFEGKSVEVADSLDDDDAKTQAALIEDETNWRQYLEVTEKGKTRSTLNNIKTILQNVCAIKGIVGRDEFANNDFYLTDTPWRSKKGDPVTDMDIVRIKFYCSEQHGVEFPDNLINQGLLEIADVNRFHPVRNYIKSLKWDGTPRLENWLETYAGAQGPGAYLRAVSRKVLVAMVKRVFEPGCQFDQVLILEGDQGAGKSSLLRRLANPWFTDQPIIMGDKDAVLTMQSKWLIELGELASLNRSEVESMKAFVSQRTDRIRAPYGKRVEEYPRQSIFIGSTNLDEYLKDETGNRRFWPVTCLGKLDFKSMERDRDQLFAEAYAYYKLGEPTYLDKEEDEQLAKIEQAQRGEVDEWFGAVADVVNGEIFPRHGFEMRQLASKLEQFGAHRLERADQQRLGKILKVLGFSKYQENVGDRRKLWAPRDWIEKRKKVENKAEFDRLNQLQGGFEPTLNQLVGSKKNTINQDFF